MPGVSVIIPTYNRGDLVTEAIESVLRQSYADLELIVVDDGSTDDTASVVGGIGDERIRYFSKDNGGQSSACNFAFRHAEGRYIAYLDSDDMWPEAYLETMVRQLDAKTDYGVAYARVIQRYPDGREEQLSKPERYRSGRITKYFFGFVPCLIPSAMCFRRSVWEGIWWDEALRRSHDFDVFLRLSTKAQFLFVPEAYSIKRWYPENLSSLPDPLNMIEKARVLERFYLHLGGQEYVSRMTAYRKISHTYRKAGRISAALGDADGALIFYRRAMKYYPMDVRLYFNMVWAVLKKRVRGKKRNWEIPAPLAERITVT